MKSLLICLAVIGCAFAVIGDEYFIGHVNKYVNHSVSPCDNFYRHVCPRNMANADRLRQHSEKTVVDWIDKGAKMLAQTRNQTHFEKILFSIGDVMDLFERYYNNFIDPTGKDQVLEEGYRVAYMYKTWMLRMHFMTAVPDVHMFAPRKLMHEIVGMAEREIEVKLCIFISDSMKYMSLTDFHKLFQVSSIPYTKKTMERFRKLLATLRSEFFDEYPASTYVKMFEDLDTFFQATGALKQFEGSNENESEEILRVLGVYGPGILNLYPLAQTIYYLVQHMFEMQAGYSPQNAVDFNDPALILSITASAPAKYGSAGFIMAHEMYHAILKSSQWTSDVKLGQHTVCLAGHMENVCNLFKEGNCSSGAITYNEDGPDMEAIQLVFKLLKKEMGDDLKKPVEGTNITNEQMFFYANAVFNCEPEDADGSINHFPAPYPSGLDVHSSGIPRVNGPISLMNAFHEAFDCKAGDRMFDVAAGREECNAFGDPVRK